MQCGARLAVSRAVAFHAERHTRPHGTAEGHHGGAVFFSPIFILWLRLEPTVAIGIALITELFGFSSGLIAYVRAQLVDYHLGANLLMFSIPGAIVGVLSADLFPAIVLKTIFAVGLMFIGLQLFLSWRQEQKEAMDELISFFSA